MPNQDTPESGGGAGVQTGAQNPNWQVSPGLERWLIGYAALWIVLIALVDFGETAELGAAFAALIAGAATFHFAPQVLQNLGLIGST